jgi:hypothetical protein
VLVLPRKRKKPEIIILPDEEMKLRDEDKEWFAGEIERQLSEVVDSFEPHGWRRLVHLLREFGPIIGTFSFVLALIAIIITVGIFATNRVSQESEFRRTTVQQFKTIDQRLSTIETSIATIRLNQISSIPASPQSIREARGIIAESKKSGTLIPDSVIKQVGTSFLKASKASPTVWEAALDFVSYHTVLNRNIAAVGSADQIAVTKVDPTLVSEYHVLSPPPGYQFPRATTGGDVPIDRAATIHSLTEAAPTLGQSRGKEVILMEGGGLVLDNTLLKNVVIRNATIFYSGGPVSLQNVIFVNCTFVLPNEAHPRDFATLVLNQGAITFTNA